MALDTPLDVISGEISAAHAQSSLRDVGVVASEDGTVSFTEDGLAKYAASPWAADLTPADLNRPSGGSDCHPVGYAAVSLAARPHTKHCRRLWIHCEALAAATLHSDMLQDSQLRADLLGGMELLAHGILCLLVRLRCGQVQLFVSPPNCGLAR